MTLNGVMAVTLCYFTELGKHAFQPGFVNIMIFSKISKYRKYRKYHDFFRYISDIFDTFDIFKSTPIMRVVLLNKLLNHVEIVSI